MNHAKMSAVVLGSCIQMMTSAKWMRGVWDMQNKENMILTLGLYFAFWTKSMISWQHLRVGAVGGQQGAVASDAQSFCGWLLLWSTDCCRMAGVCLVGHIDERAIKEVSCALMSLVGGLPAGLVFSHGETHQEIKLGMGYTLLGVWMMPWLWSKTPSLLCSAHYSHDWAMSATNPTTA